MRSVRNVGISRGWLACAALTTGVLIWAFTSYYGQTPVLELNKTLHRHIEQQLNKNSPTSIVNFATYDEYNWAYICFFGPNMGEYSLYPVTMQAQKALGKSSSWASREDLSTIIFLDIDQRPIKAEPIALYVHLMPGFPGIDIYPRNITRCHDKMSSSFLFKRNDDERRMYTGWRLSGKAN